MDGQIVCQSLFALKGDDLRMVFALLCRTNISNIVSSKTMDYLSADEQNHLLKHLLQVVKSVKDISDEKLRFYLFLEMTKVAGIKGVRYSSEEQIVQQASKIIDEVYNLLQKQEKDFINVKTLDGLSKLQQILIYQIDKLLLKLPKIFLDFNKEDKLAIATKIVHFYETLTGEEQKKLKNEWKVTAVNPEILANLSSQKSLETVLFSLRRVGGFTYYVQLIPELFTLIQRTQREPITQSLKWVIDPTNISDLIGFGNIIWKMQHSELQKCLLPIVILQLCLLYSGSEEEYDYYPSTLLLEWKNRFQIYIKLKKGQGHIESRQHNIFDEIKARVEILRQTEANIAECLQEINRERNRILLELKKTDLNSIAISKTFYQYVQELYVISKRIEDIKSTQTASTNKSSIFTKVSHSFSKLYREYNLNEEEKKLDSLFLKMIDEVLNSSLASSFCQDERQNITFLTQLLTKLNEQKSTEQQNKSVLENKLDLVNKELAAMKEEIHSFEKEIYGLNDLSLLPEDFLMVEEVIQEQTKMRSEQHGNYLKKKQMFVHNYESTIANLERQNQQAFADLETKQIAIVTLEQEVERLNKEVGNLTSSIAYAAESEQKKQVLLQQNKQLQELLHQSKELLEEKEKQSSQLLQDNNSNWECKYEELEQAAETQIKILFKENQEWKARYEMLEGNLQKRDKETETQNQLLLKQNQEWQAKYELLEADLQKRDKKTETQNQLLLIQNQEWQSKYEMLEVNLQKRDKETETQNRLLLKQIQEWQEKHQMLMVELDDRGAEIRNLKEQFEQQVHKLSRDLAKAVNSKRPFVTAEKNNFEEIPFEDLFAEDIPL